MKNKWSKNLLLMLCLAALLTAVIPALAQSDKPVVYEYALLGQEYVPQQGLRSATDPNGAAVGQDGQPIALDWAQGSYRFEYEDKIVDVKVYESAPADTLICSEQIPESVANGVAAQFPGLTVKSGISRTDGAPEIEPYAVRAVFWFGGEKVQTVVGANDPFSFTPRQSGQWLLCYEYTDVFGVNRSVNYPFLVEDRRVMVMNFDEAYFVGQKISTAAAYGFYCQTNYPAALTVTAPDGTAENITDTYTFTAGGVYTLTAAADIEGENLTRSVTVTVEAGMQSFLTNTTGFDSGAEGTRHLNTQTLSKSDSGLVLNMTASTASLRYNGIVDLNKLGKDTPVISFSTNHTYGGAISAVEVTLTDVYDPDNKLTVQFKRNSDITAEALGYDNTLVSAVYGNTKAGVGNYAGLPDDAVAWDTTFHSYWRSSACVSSKKTYGPAESLQAMNFSFDAENQVVYSYGRYHLVGWDAGTKPSADYPTATDAGWYPIADLRSSKLAEQFAGFTTGEVYLELSVTSGRGDVIIYSIGGVGMNDLEQSYNSSDALALNGFGQDLPAVKNMPCALPTAVDGLVTDMTVTVSKDGEEVPCQGNSFTPTETGDYTVTFRAVNQFGIAVEKQVTLPAIEKPELTLSYPETAVKLGTLYTVQEPVVSGYGTIACSITVNGKQVQPGDKLAVTEEMTIVVTATDLLDTKQIETILTVDKDYVEFTGDFPRAAICGTTFTFPAFTVYDYLSGQTLEYTVYADGQKQEQTMTLPEEPTVLQVEYRTQRGSKYFTLQVRAAEVTTGADALILPSGATAETNDAGTVVTVRADAPTVGLPYKLSASSLPVQIAVLEEQLNFDGIGLRLTSGSGVCVALSVRGLQSAEPYLYINETNTLVKVQKQAQIFASGVYEGKIYYTFTLEYHDFYRALMNGAKIEAYVDTDADGVSFDGFRDGVYLDICPMGMQESVASFVLTQVSNQYFYQSAFEYGDIVAPALYTGDFVINHNYVSLGDTLKLSGLKAYDVLTPDASVAVTMTLSDGTDVCRDAAPETVADITFADVGVYTLKIVTADSANVKKESVYRFTVEDQAGPVITVDGAVPETVKTGESLTVPGATAQDDTAVTLKAVLLRPDFGVETLSAGDGQTEAVTLQNLTAGIYKIRYTAADARGNITTQVYIVNVED